MKIESDGSESVIRHKFTTTFNDEPFNVFVYVNDIGMSVFDVYPDDIFADTYNVILDNCKNLVGVNCR